MALERGVLRCAVTGCCDPGDLNADFRHIDEYPHSERGVDDIDEVRQRVLGAGGRILMEKFTISKVGHLIAFEDPGGNAVRAMQYDVADE